MVKKAWKFSIYSVSSVAASFDRSGAPDDHGFEYVEHLNDLALDCRESNLRKSTTLNGNNLHMNRLKHAFWAEGVKGAARKAEESSNRRSHTGASYVVCRRFLILCSRSSVSSGREIHHKKRRRCNQQGVLRTSSDCCAGELTSCVGGRCG